jgi:hypothetical protein
MIRIWIFAIVATVFALTPVRASDTTFTLVGTSEKVCQLNGDTDWKTGLPTAAQTATNFGMSAADLGAPVDTGGSTLYFLFGDTWPSFPPPPVGVKPPNDSVGTSTLTTTPASNTCLDLQIATVPSSTPPTFAPPVVTPTIDQGSFNVPSGGVYADPSLYVFFWTKHCDHPSLLVPSPSDPLKRPMATSGTGGAPDCSEKAKLNSIGISVLGQSAGTSDVAFNTPTGVTMPSGFVYVNAVDATHKPNLAPKDQRKGVFITGVPRYRASVPYLAYSSAANLADPSNWMFFNGLVGGAANWITYTTWESYHDMAGRWVPPSSGAQLYSATTSEECIGEHSLSWNAPLDAWLLLYNCKGYGIEARYARAPWGPWSDPIVLLSTTHDPGIYCTLIMSPSGCGTLTNYQPLKKDGSYTSGGLYAPFVLSRFTEDASPHCYPHKDKPVGLLVSCTNIYWLVSTWNPYLVVVMKSTLMMTTFR